MNDNWYALCLTICNPNFGIDSAISYIADGIYTVDGSVAEEMAILKQTMTYKQIADMYEVKADAVYNRIRRYEGRC